MLECHRQIGHDRSVVQHAGQRVATRGLDELPLLPADAHVRRPEDQEEQRRQDRRRPDHHDDDVALRLADALQEWACVAPDGHHRTGRVAVVDDREVLAYHGRRVERWSRDIAVDLARQLSVGPVLHHGALHLGGQRRVRSDCCRVAGEQHGAPRRADLDAQDAVLGLQRGELRPQLRGACRARATGPEVVAAQIAVHEQLGERRVALDAGVHRRLGEVRGRDGDQGAGRDSDEDEEHAEDEHQEHRAPGARRRAFPPAWSSHRAPSVGAQQVRRDRTMEWQRCGWRGRSAHHGPCAV
jgi:hypothetical protein